MGEGLDKDSEEAALRISRSVKDLLRIARRFDSLSKEFETLGLDVGALVYDVVESRAVFVEKLGTKNNKQ